MGHDVYALLHVFGQDQAIPELYGLAAFGVRPSYNAWTPLR